MDLEYMDSSGVGMLLVLQEMCRQNGTHVTIINIGKDIKSLFEKSALGKLFDVTYKN